MELKSVLNQVIQDIYASKTANEAKQHFVGLLEASNIKKEDKVKMLDEVEKMNSLIKIQTYATNAMFKFEGLSVNKK